jgi:radical SAM superfamily enzyme YgiQ (UPF0313 family)
MQIEAPARAPSFFIFHSSFFIPDLDLMISSRRKALLVQLPIPPPGPQAIHGNVPLAAGYLKLFARRRGLEEFYQIEILPNALADVISDQGLVEAILAREPWMVGLTCYVWNIQRSLWVAQRLKAARPDLKIALGGPEIAADNGWVLEHPAVDFAVIGEGEQTFAELLDALLRGPAPDRAIDGLAVLPGGTLPSFRKPLADLDEICSPYLEGILDAADERLMLLETVRGCRFRCKFCYYPKSYDSLYMLSGDKIEESLRYARERDVDEVSILDPTLNQRRDFLDFLRLLVRNNPAGRFTYTAELRAEGINAQSAALLKEANFTEVEIGLQSTDPQAQELMSRKVHLPAFERGARAMLDAGIRVRTDLILGLPGDTVESIRRGIDYLAETRLFTDVQVFNLSVLPGTAFRQEAQRLGLSFQTRPPYYVLQTPTLDLQQLYLLMEEAQEAFGIEFDPFPPPLASGEWRGARGGSTPRADGLEGMFVADLDGGESAAALPPPGRRTQAFTLWLRGRELDRRRKSAVELIRRLLDDNPHSTLQVVIEPAAAPYRLSLETLEVLQAACFQSTRYLDLYYSLHPNRLLGAKRLVVLLPEEARQQIGLAWIRQAGDYAGLAWLGGRLCEESLESHEHVVRRTLMP